MAAEMAKRHKNLYHSVSKERFEGAVAVLDERIPSLARHQVIVEMARIAALVGDGHTNIAPTRDPKIGFRSLPVRFYLFKDGLFIRAARKGEGTLAGTRWSTCRNISLSKVPFGRSQTRRWKNSSSAAWK